MPKIPTNQILIGDTIKTLNNMPPEFADLIFADPPYNVRLMYRVAA